MYWIVFVYLFFLSFYAFGEQLLNQDVDISSGSTLSNDSGLTIVDLNKNYNSTRPVISLGYEYQLSKNQLLQIKGQYQELPYQGMTETNLYSSYNFLF